MSVSGHQNNVLVNMHRILFWISYVSAVSVKTRKGSVLFSFSCVLYCGIYVVDIVLRNTSEMTVSSCLKGLDFMPVKVWA